jgi:hypothetical protein
MTILSSVSYFVDLLDSLRRRASEIGVDDAVWCRRVLVGLWPLARVLEMAHCLKLLDVIPESSENGSAIRKISLQECESEKIVL